MLGRKHFKFLLADVDPRIVKDIAGRRTLGWLLLENLEQEHFSLGRNMFWDLELLSANVRVELLVVLAFEGEPATKERK